MQTAKQVEKRIRNMLTENTMRQHLVDESLRLYRSGAIDAEKYSDKDGAGPFMLPKLLLCEALRRESKQYEPFSDDARKALRNLRHF